MGSVADFYAGKTVLLTGAGGFVGEVLLEALLRCCPGIVKIYGILRDKKGVTAVDRRELIFKKKLFEPLRKNHPDVLKKFVVFHGDVSQPNLGLNDADLQVVTTEVSVVFHVAATISFLKTLRFMVMNNSMSVYYTVELCRKIKKFEVLIYTSTGGANLNRKTRLEEVVYRLPFPAQRFVDTALNGTDEELANLVAECEPKWPNHYTFSKCLGENILQDMAQDMKIAIIRPLGIACTWKAPVQGYIEDQSGLTAFGLGISKGFIKCVHADPEVNLDVIPVDVVVNAHLITGSLVATKRIPSPYVAHTVLYGKVPLVMRHCADVFCNFMKIHYPIPETFRRTDFTVIICKSKLKYLLLSAYYHYLPAVVMDAVLLLIGKKPKVTRMYKFYDKALNCLHYFVSYNWDLVTTNFHNLDAMISEEDRELFYTDLSEMVPWDVLNSVIDSAPFMDRTRDKRTVEERKKVADLRGLVTTIIQKTAIVCVLIFLYFFILYLFRIFDTSF